jgi:hypothetical protein
MILPAASCATGDGDTETKGPGETVAETEEDTGYKPDIQKNDYDAEFNIVAVDNLSKWLVADEATAGDPFMDTIYERGVRIQDHLGVDLVLIQRPGDMHYAEDIVRTVQAGDDAYQLIGAARHNGVSTLLASGALYDFAELESVNLDAPYWARDIMGEYLINDHYFVGYNDSCLADVSCMVFNKDLAVKYNLKEPYDDVRNMKWTLSTMTAFASDVAEDNGDGVWDIKDTYGITGDGHIDFIALNTSCGIKMVDKDADGSYHVAYNDNPEKMVAYLKQVDQLDKAEFTFFGKPYDALEEVSFDDGRALLRMQMTSELVIMRDCAVRFGILPYPMYDELQGEYKSLNWNGLLMIPGSIKDTAMVGEVVELMAHYTTPVKTAFFEDLLGSKLSEAPDDAAMLNIIWDSQTSDVCLGVSSNDALSGVLYMVGFLCKDGIDQYASYLKVRSKAGNSFLDKLFNPRIRN